MKHIKASIFKKLVLRIDVKDVIDSAAPYCTKSSQMLSKCHSIKASFICFLFGCTAQ